MENMEELSLPGSLPGGCPLCSFSPPRTQDSSTSNLLIMDRNWNAPLSFSSERYVPEGRDPAGPKSLGLSLGPAEQRFLKAVGLKSGKCHTILHAASPTATSLPPPFQQDGALIVCASGSQLTLCPALHTRVLLCKSLTLSGGYLCYTHFAGKEIGD